MYHKTLFHKLPSGNIAKFTIRERRIKEKKYYYANVINIELESYKKMSNSEQEMFYGIEITNGRQQSINYSNPNRLIEDILSKYGHEWLETEE